MRLLVCVLLLILWIPAAVLAQEDAATLDEAEFWTRLAQTETLLGGASETVNPATRDAILQLWEGVQRVRLPDTVITIDVRWITIPLASENDSELPVLKRQVQALLADHERQVSGHGRSPELAALEDVLQDSRFQYAEQSPTPLPTALPDFDLEPVTQSVSPALSQIVLILMVGLGLAALVMYVARNLRVQPAMLEGVAEDAADPQTANQATELAVQSAGLHDYRAAIRYLYLSSLMRLDERGLLHYEAALTNREHLRQVRTHPQLYEVLRSVVNVFEDVWYGYSPVDEALYRQYLEHIERLKRMVP